MFRNVLRFKLRNLSSRLKRPAIRIYIQHPYIKESPNPEEHYTSFAGCTTHRTVDFCTSSQTFDMLFSPILGPVSDGFTSHEVTGTRPRQTPLVQMMLSVQNLNEIANSSTCTTNVSQDVWRWYMVLGIPKFCNILNVVAWCSSSRVVPTRDMLRCLSSIMKDLWIESLDTGWYMSERRFTCPCAHSHIGHGCFLLTSITLHNFLWVLSLYGHLQELVFG